MKRIITDADIQLELDNEIEFKELDSMIPALCNELDALNDALSSASWIDDVFDRSIERDEILIELESVDTELTDKLDRWAML